MNQKQLGFKEAKAITKYFAKTFYLASLFLPKDKRLASYAIYAICRISDESVDSNSVQKKEEKINEIKSKIDASYGTLQLNDNLLAAFRDTINKYCIPKDYFDELLEGMRMDLSKKHYNNTDELRLYCYRVAGVVGLIMLRIFGYDDKNAQTYALRLGEAMQLTNILRDIKEDMERKRIYLPIEDLNQFGLTDKDIQEMHVSKNFKSMMKSQIYRIRKTYEESLKGISLIKCRRSRFVTLAMIEMYSGILKEIERMDYNIFSKRIAVNKPRKLWLIIKILLKGRYL
jgi:phytoene synthase